MVRTMTGTNRKAIAAAIFDPGATEGPKGERTLTEWQTDAVMRVLSALTASASEPVTWLVKCIKGDFVGSFEIAQPNEKATNPEHWTDAFPVYASPVPASEPEPVALERTYYTEGKDCPFYEALSDKEFAWEATKMAQDLADMDTRELEEILPFVGVLSLAADRIERLANPVPTPDGAVEALRCGVTPDQYETASNHLIAAAEGVLDGLAVEIADARKIMDFVLTETFGRAALSVAQAPAQPEKHQGVTEDDQAEKLAELEAIVAEHNDELALIDWISDKIGLPHDEELSRENFAQWLTALQAGEADGWRDIESAPKDGSRILSAKNFGGKVHEAAIIRWSETEDEWWDDDADQYAFPDLWMPLHAAPASKEERE